MVRLLNCQGLKNCQSTKSFCLRIQIITKMIDSLKFWQGYCCHVFFSVRFLNMCKPGARFCLLRRDGRTGLAFYGRGPARLLSWLGIVNAGWLGSMRSEMFKAAHQTGYFFYLGSPPLKINSLFSHFCLF